LQHSLLPTALPECSGVEFASRYVPAEALGVGGDWYDAFCFPSGDLWIIAGDVAGHGFHAAVVMGRLRSAIRAYALEGYEPGTLLARADRKLQFFEPGQMATAFCALLRAPYDTIQIASAGHLPAAMAVPGKGPALIPHPISPPLGSVDNLAPDALEIEFPLGAVLVAYTDGLIERREDSIEVGFARLLDAMDTDHPEIVCRHLMEKLVGQTVPKDDVAIIAARRVAD
jgi:serine phosphatase RsbU (regulator of sigma subunit)